MKSIIPLVGVVSFFGLVILTIVSAWLNLGWLGASAMTCAVTFVTCLVISEK